MKIEGGDIPKSTLAVGGILWSIIAAMTTWVLVTVLNSREKQIEQSGEIKLLISKLDSNTAEMKELKGSVVAIEKRVSALESRR